jgi:hypothetical protein
VQKLLLARALRNEGVAHVVTGDGADHVFRRDRAADYLPLVQAACDACDVTLHAPFLDDDVIAHIVGLPIDEHKTALRDVGRALGVVDELVSGPKRARLTPALDTSGLLAAGELEAVAQVADRVPPAEFIDDKQRMLWTTAALLLRQF